MATPIVHAGIGVAVTSLIYVCYRKRISNYKPYIICCFGMTIACLPDIDLIVSYAITGDVRTYHFGISHSLSFCILGGLLGYLWKRVPGCVWVFTLLVSHVAVDGLTGPNFGKSPTVGIQPMLPLSEWVFVSPFTVFNGIKHSDWFSYYNFYRVFIDLVIFVPLMIVCYGWIKRQYESKI